MRKKWLVGAVAKDETAMTNPKPAKRHDDASHGNSWEV